MPKSALRIATLAGFVVMITLGPITLLPSVRAQETASAIQYGQIRESRITDKIPELKYSFEGQKAEVVVVRMDSGQGDAGLRTPAFTILSGNNKIIDSTKIFTLSLTIAYAVFRLPEDGKYIIVATRRGGKEGKDVGEFGLSLNKAVPMELDKPIQDQSSHTVEKYYVVEPANPFTVSYVRIGGRFRPAVFISVLRNGGATEPVAELSGRALDSGTMGVTPENKGVYVIRVTRAFLSTSTGEAQYRLTVSLR